MIGFALAVSEKDAFAEGQLATRSDESFPDEWIVIRLSGEQDFHFAAQKVATGGIMHTDWLRMTSTSTSE